MSGVRETAVLDQEKLAGASRNVKPEGVHEAVHGLAHRRLRADEWWRKVPAFAGVDEETFLDHRWQLRHTVKTPDKLMEVLKDLVSEAFCRDVEDGFRLAPMSVRVTPYILSLINWDDPMNDPLRRQFIPVGSTHEEDHPLLTLDSLNEQGDAATPGLVHRYPDKALLLALDTCPVYCRFCTRSYAVGLDTENVEKLALRPNPRRWEEAFAYLEKHPEIEDVVISGGDVYNLGPKHLRTIGHRLLDIPHIRRFRYATKGIAVMPQKILSDGDWVDALTEVADRGREEGRHVAVHTHFNTAREITQHSRRAVKELIQRGITVRNQAVLQRGVNDTEAGMIMLTKRLSYINVEPYYVYMHDLVSGVEDLRTSLATGIRLEKAVRGVTAGFNTPTFVVDAPGGGGKREIHSFEAYDRNSGVSVYTAPSVKPGEQFVYVDPLSVLPESGRRLWHSSDGHQELVRRTLDAARANERVLNG